MGLFGSMSLGDAGCTPSCTLFAPARKNGLAKHDYGSRNPPTLGRDIADLQSRFSVLSIPPFDMFPQTAEIEVVAHLQAL
jgi:hypothetical protein